MRSIIRLLAIFVLGMPLVAQNTMLIHKSGNITPGAKIASADSIYFSDNQETIYFSVNGNIKEYPMTDVDSLTFTNNPNTVFVNYDGTEASVINPYAFEGVDVTINGADVTITSVNEIKDIDYQLTGSTSDGSFKIYSDKRFNVVMNGVSIQNNDGASINNQSSKKATIILNDGTNNVLTDGTNYDEASFPEEDQKAALFSESQIFFSGNGTLEVNGIGDGKHAIASDDEVTIESGTVIVKSSDKDGVHGKDGFFMEGGLLTITSKGDGIDGDEGNIDISGGEIQIFSNEDDVKAIKADSTIVISGGSITLDVTGDQSKAISSDMDITLSGGNINITTSGNAVLEENGSGYDPSYCSAIKCDANVIISGAEISIKATGKAGKGISADGDFNMTSGKLLVTTSGDGAKYTNSDGEDDAYKSACISADGNINIIGGELELTSSGSAGRGITGNAELTIGSLDSTPVILITTSGQSVQISSGGGWGGPPGGPGEDSGEAAEAKAITIDGKVIINSGNITISSADDGIKSKESITFNNGTIELSKSVEGFEAPIITVNDGDLRIISSDDCFNSTSGAGGEQNDNSQLNLNGGYIYLSSTNGDPIDSNGDMTMTGGTVIVHGPQSGVEVGIDVNGTKNISGGTVAIAAGNSHMLETFSTSSSQPSFMIKSQSSLSAGTLIHIEDESGNTLVTFKPIRSYASFIYSSPLLESGKTYKIYTGGIDSGENKDGIFNGGTYSGGTLKKSFNVSGSVTTLTI